VILKKYTSAFNFYPAMVYCLMSSEGGHRESLMSINAANVAATPGKATMSYFPEFKTTNNIRQSN